VSNPPAGWQPYTIQPGDTLSRLATQRGTSVEQIVNVNCIANPDVINPSQSIFLPPLPGPTNTPVPPTPVPGQPPTNTPTNTPVPPQVVIQISGSINVANGQTGMKRQPDPNPVSGSYSGPSSHIPWLLVQVLGTAQVPGNMRYYPQSNAPQNGEPPVLSGGTWSVNVYLGSATSPPECFKLILVAADANASNIFSQNLRDGHVGGFMGLEELPNWVKELDVKNVSTGDSQQC
jgi:hypothetical protein